MNRYRSGSAVFDAFVALLMVAAGAYLLIHP